MDLVIPVRAGTKNESLRYALRSYAQYLPHATVWLVGGKPGWIRNVQHIPTAQRGSKYSNTTLAMRKACEHPEISASFVWAADDIFSMAPIADPVPVYHRGRMVDLENYLARKYRGRNPYLAGLRATRNLLAQLGHKDPLSYEVHVPLVIDSARMLEVLDIGKRIPALHKRSLYGNVHRVGGTRLRDPKVLTRGPTFPKHAAWLSTMPDTFRRGAVGQHIRRTFNIPCRYEQAGV